MSLTFTWLINQTFDGTLLRDFLRDEIHLSKRALIELKFNGGNITINDNEVNVRHKLSNGEKLTITFPNEKRSESLIPKKINLKILYEDDHLLVVNKSPNFATTPSREHPSHSLANGLAYYYNEQGNSNAVHIVTRLDRDTSGLVLVAKHRFAHHLFSIQQKNRAISRSYIAIVHGELKNSYGKINKPIGRHPDSIIERMVREDGKQAITNYEVLEKKKNKTLVKLMLETGRTHQIRVHMAALGHPLFGDTLYGGKKEIIQRQALHCKQLDFLHPFNHNKPMTFQCDIPKDICFLWQSET